MGYDAPGTEHGPASHERDAAADQYDGKPADVPAARHEPSDAARDAALLDADVQYASDRVKPALRRSADSAAPAAKSAARTN